MWKTISWWMILFFITSEGNSSSKRVKRVLGGRIYTNVKEDAYKVISYYATFADLHEKPFLGTWWLTQAAIRRGTYGEIKCGGVLLTPEIVQTACHCISTWVVNPQYLGFVSRPWVEHHWEEIKVVYIGVTSRFYNDDKPSMINVKPIKTLKFVAHPGCGRIEYEPQPRTYDYGWIRVDPDWQKPYSKVPNRGVSFVPMYSKDHNELWMKRVLETQMVCMHVGFGYFDIWKAYTSTRLRIGWGVAAPELACINGTASNVPKKYLPELMNWFCVESFGENKGTVLTGDSGGPVACDNVMVGVVSGHRADFYHDGRTLNERWWSIHGSVTKNHWAMSVEYRKRFDDWMHDIAVTTFLELAIFVYTPFNYPYATKSKFFSESQVKRFTTPSVSQRANSASVFSFSSVFVAGAVFVIGRHFER